MSEFEQKCDSAQPLVAALFRAPFATHGKARKGAVPLLSNVHRGIIARLFAQGKGHEQPRRRAPSRSCNWTRPCPSGRLCNLGRTPTLQSAAPQPCNQPHQPHPNLASPLIFFGTNSRWGFQETTTAGSVLHPLLHAAAHAGVKCKYAGHWEKAHRCG